MSVLDLRNEPRLFYGSAEARALYRGAERVWSKPAPPISTWYGIGPGQVPMDHKYAQGVANGGLITSVPNLGGAGAMFNLTVNGTVPIVGNGVDLDPNDYFSLASQADVVGTRLFVVVDFRSVDVNQFIAGQGETNADGGKTNLLLLAGGGSLRLAKNDGTNVNATIPLSPPVAPLIRLYEIEDVPGGNVSVWINAEFRGSTPNPHASYLIKRIAAGQSTGGGINGVLYRTLSLIQGGDYAARVQAIRARLNQEYGLGMAA
ncbi:hypothetical protein [Paracoccus indicus]|uniref:hypothetical protein n=1 Tax=Paracoccus indicus TaxID=2079229 RepID=UPI0013B38205|nr:hypothetical protein [Paracoccus indicus]